MGLLGVNHHYGFICASDGDTIALMIHRYEGVCVAKVKGFIEAEDAEEARAKLELRDFGEVTDIYLQALNLMDDLDPVEEEDG